MVAGKRSREVINPFVNQAMEFWAAINPKPIAAKMTAPRAAAAAEKNNLNVQVRHA